MPQTDSRLTNCPLGYRTHRNSSRRHYPNPHHGGQQAPGFFTFLWSELSLTFINQPCECITLPSEDRLAGNYFTFWKTFLAIPRQRPVKTLRHPFNPIHYWIQRRKQKQKPSGSLVMLDQVAVKPKRTQAQRWSSTIH